MDVQTQAKAYLGGIIQWTEHRSEQRLRMFTSSVFEDVIPILVW